MLRNYNKHFLGIVTYILALQSNFDGSNIFGIMEIFFEIWIVRATEG